MAATKVLGAAGRSALQYGKSAARKVLPARKKAVIDNLVDSLPQLADEALNTGGFSASISGRAGRGAQLLPVGERGFGGTMMARRAETGLNRIPLENIRDRKALRKAVNDLIDQDPQIIKDLSRGRFLGGWVEDGALVVDTPSRFIRSGAAGVAGRRSGQQAGFRLGTAETPTPDQLIGEQITRRLRPNLGEFGLGGLGGVITAADVSSNEGFGDASLIGLGLMAAGGGSAAARNIAGRSLARRFPEALNSVAPDALRRLAPGLRTRRGAINLGANRGSQPPPPTLAELEKAARQPLVGAGSYQPVTGLGMSKDYSWVAKHKKAIEAVNADVAEHNAKARAANKALREEAKRNNQKVNRKNLAKLRTDTRSLVFKKGSDGKYVAEYTDASGTLQKVEWPEEMVYKTYSGKTQPIEPLPHVDYASTSGMSGADWDALASSQRNDIRKAMEKNIRTVLDDVLVRANAGEPDAIQALEWYFNLPQQVFPRYAPQLSRAGVSNTDDLLAGLTAVLSPREKVSSNIDAVGRAISGTRKGSLASTRLKADELVTGRTSPSAATTYDADGNVIKTGSFATDIWAGSEAINQLAGRRPTGLFQANVFNNIVSPDVVQASRAVTVDVWADRLATGINPQAVFNLGDPKIYNMIADVFRKAADDVGVPPMVAQSGVWDAMAKIFQQSRTTGNFASSVGTGLRIDPILAMPDPAMRQATYIRRLAGPNSTADQSVGAEYVKSLAKDLNMTPEDLLKALNVRLG
jgi:hypothetical protein